MSYYGAALHVVDVNGDGWDDLFIGAPFQKTRSGDEGVVEVYYGGQVIIRSNQPNHTSRES